VSLRLLIGIYGPEYASDEWIRSDTSNPINEDREGSLWVKDCWDNSNGNLKFLEEKVSEGRV